MQTTRGRPAVDPRKIREQVAARDRRGNLKNRTIRKERVGKDGTVCEPPQNEPVNQLIGSPVHSFVSIG